MTPAGTRHSSGHRGKALGTGSTAGAEIYLRDPAMLPRAPRARPATGSPLRGPHHSRPPGFGASRPGLGPSRPHSPRVAGLNSARLGSVPSRSASPPPQPALPFKRTALPPAPPRPGPARPPAPSAEQTRSGCLPGAERPPARPAQRRRLRSAIQPRCCGGPAPAPLQPAPLCGRCEAAGRRAAPQRRSTGPFPFTVPVRAPPRRDSQRSPGRAGPKRAALRRGVRARGGPSGAAPQAHLRPAGGGCHGDARDGGNRRNGRTCRGRGGAGRRRPPFSSLPRGGSVRDLPPREGNRRV